MNEEWCRTTRQEKDVGSLFTVPCSCPWRPWRLMASWRFGSTVAIRSTISARKFPIVGEKFPVLEEKFPINREKFPVLEEKRFFWWKGRCSTQRAQSAQRKWTWAIPIKPGTTMPYASSASSAPSALGIPCPPSAPSALRTPCSSPVFHRKRFFCQTFKDLHEQMKKKGRTQVLGSGVRGAGRGVRRLFLVVPGLRGMAGVVGEAEGP